jgi:hypothetical protein
MEATGFTVNTNEVGVPEQPSNVGVTVIVPEIAVLKMFVAMNAPMVFVPVAAKPMEVLLLAQLKTVPLTVPVNTTAVLCSPTQSTWFDTASTVGVGFTLTVRVKVAPVQLPEIGVTVYGTSIGAFVVFDKVPVIELALLPAEVPFIPETDVAIHEYKVPAGTTLPSPSEGVNVKGLPEQIVIVCG